MATISPFFLGLGLHEDRYRQLKLKQYRGIPKQLLKNFADIPNDATGDMFGQIYVLANPPFNVDDVNLAKVEADRRFNTYGIPRNKTGAKAKDKGSVTVPTATTSGSISLRLH